MISTRCRTPTGRSSTRASGSTWRPCRSEISTIRRLAAATSSRPRAAGGLHAEHDVLGDGEHGHEHEVLVDHADAGGDGVARVVERDRRVVDQDLALVGPVEPVEDVHQRGLAGAVLAQEGVDLAGLARRGRSASFATTPGNRFVMPRSSSFTRTPRCRLTGCRWTGSGRVGGGRGRSGATRVAASMPKRAVRRTPVGAGTAGTSGRAAPRGCRPSGGAAGAGLSWP